MPRGIYPRSNPGMAQPAMPKYKLREAAHLNDILYNVEVEDDDGSFVFTSGRGEKVIEFDGTPGPYMEPQNELAVKRMQEFGFLDENGDPIERVHPIDKLPLTNATV
jgi:hypothetical protein